MEMTLLNMIFVFSFAFVSVALGLKWIGEIILQVVLAKQGLMISRDRLMEEDDEEV
jgi:hypothetical protein